MIRGARRPSVYWPCGNVQEQKHASRAARPYRVVRVNPISTPLARAGDIDLVSKRLAVRNTALSDPNGAIVPGCLVQKHAMVVERTGVVEVVGRVNDEGVIRADRDRRRAGSLNKNGEEAERKDGNPRPSTVDTNCTSWHAQTIWADVVRVGEVPPHFVNTCGDSDSAGEGEQEGREGSSHCQRGRGD